MSSWCTSLHVVVKLQVFYAMHNRADCMRLAHGHGTEARAACIYALQNRAGCTGLAQGHVTGAWARAKWMICGSSADHVNLSTSILPTHLHLQVHLAHYSFFFTCKQRTSCTICSLFIHFSFTHKQRVSCTIYICHSLVIHLQAACLVHSSSLNHFSFTLKQRISYTLHHLFTVHSPASSASHSRVSLGRFHAPMSRWGPAAAAAAAAVTMQEWTSERVCNDGINVTMVSRRLR